uniref:Uncharacterized protein n=1 Tax=Arundo donax TaxID=35708 RepID=A0A0A9U7J6_ARUDO
MLASLLIHFFCNVKLNHMATIAASNFQTDKSNRAEPQTRNQFCSLNNTTPYPLINKLASSGEILL